MPPRLRLRASALGQIPLQWNSGIKVRPLPSLTLKVANKLSSRCLNAPRSFSQTSITHKKGGKAAREEKNSSAAENASAVEDANDFSTLNAGIEKALAKLHHDLSKLRTGGRFNPELLEGVRVQLKNGNTQSIRLGDLAQVVPKGGKSIVVLVGEADHVKPVISAIQGSKDLNLQPQQDPQNALQLNIPVPPPTKESRDLALGAAGKVGEKASTAIRDARGAMQKRLRAMELSKAARPDDIRKAHKEMEKVVEKGNADAKKGVEAARKAMEQL